MLFRQKKVVCTTYRQFFYMIFRKVVYISYTQKIFLSIPNVDGNVLSIPHEEKLLVPHINTKFLSIGNIDKISTYDVDKTFMSVLDIEKCFILCINNTSKYDIDRTNFYISQRKPYYTV